MKTQVITIGRRAALTGILGGIVLTILALFFQVYLELL
jgi:hypothetical protein